MSYAAVAVGIGLEGAAATIAAGAMMGATVTVGGNVIGGRDPFENLAQGAIMGGITAGIAPGLNDMTGVGMPAAAGITAGGLTTAMTGGDLNKGLKAGLMAYGTAGLAEGADKGIANANTNSEAWANFDSNQNAIDSFVNETPMSVEGASTLSTADTLKAGVKGIGAMPTSELAKYGATTLMGSGALDPQELDIPEAHSPEGYIRPKYYDYRTQTFYDLPAVKAKDWGSRSFDEYRNSMVAKPVRAAANGGLMGAAAHFAEGGDTSVGDLYRTILGREGEAGGMEHWTRTFGDTVDENEKAIFLNAAQAELANRTPEERTALAPNLMGANNPYFQANKDVAESYAQNSYGMTPEQFAQSHYQNYGSKEGRDNPTLEAQYTNPYLLANQDVAREYAANPYGMTPQQMADYHYNTYGKNEQRADQATNANEQVSNLYRMALGRDPDPAGLKYWTDRWNSGTNEQDLYKDMQYAAKQNTELGNQNMTLEEANRAYSGYKSTDPTTNADEWVRNVLGREITAADRKTDWYKQATDASTNADVAAAKGIYNSFLGYAKAEGATTTSQKLALAREVISQKGLTDEDVYQQTGKSIEQLIGKPKTDLDIWHASQLLAPSGSEFDFAALKGKEKTTPQTYAPAGTSNPYGNTTNPGDITKNADGSKTVTPNIPGRPYGGFTGMDQVKNAYVQGGGSLGQTLRPTQTYQNTGASAAAYDYLGGQGAYPTRAQNKPMYANTPVTDTTSKYIWKDNALVPNPNYLDPAKAAAAATEAPPAYAGSDVNAGANGGLMSAARYAKGGLARFADGGNVNDQIAAAYQAGDIGQVNSLIGSANMTADQANSIWGAGVSDLAKAAGVNFASAPPAASTGISSAAPAAPAYTSYTDAQAENFFKTNPNVDIAAATKEFNADPAAVNRYIANLSLPYKDPTATQGGSGTLGVIQNTRSLGIDPTEFATAMQANNADWGKGDSYWNQGTVSRAYDVADKVLAFDPQTDKVTPSDKEWVSFMDTNSITVDDIARLTGAPISAVQARYDAAKTKPVVTPSTPAGGGSTKDTAAGTVTTTPATYRPEGATNPYGNYINPGDITINPDKSRTVTPNVPGRPYGGFTGAKQVRDAYTAGGGNLGQTLAPTTTYQNTGLSASAYDYLSGKGDWPTNTQKKPVYADTAVNTKDQYVWRNNMLVPNPDYVDPTKKKDDGVVTKTDVLNAANDSGAGANGGSMPRDLRYADGGISVGSRYDPNIDGMGQGNPYSSFQPTVGRFAAGGETQYNLGSYSDGGRLLKGPGDGVSDSIPATIGKGQPARLADGEFVIPARIVSEIGNGSTDAGARKLYAMMDRVQAARGKTVGKGKIAKNTRADKYLPK